MKNVKSLIWLLTLVISALCAIGAAEIGIVYTEINAEQRHVGHYRDTWWIDCYRLLQKTDKSTYESGMEAAKDFYSHSSVQLTPEEEEIAKAAVEAASPFSSYVSTAPDDYEGALKHYREAAWKEFLDIAKMDLIIWAASGLFGAGFIGVPIALIINTIVERKRKIYNDGNST